MGPAEPVAQDGEALQAQVRRQELDLAVGVEGVGGDVVLEPEIELGIPFLVELHHPLRPGGGEPRGGEQDVGLPPGGRQAPHQARGGRRGVLLEGKEEGGAEDEVVGGVGRTFQGLAVQVVHDEPLFQQGRQGGKVLRFVGEDPPAGREAGLEGA